MVIKKKLPLAVVISMSTMLMMHVFMPLNLHASERELEGGGDVGIKNKPKLHPLEFCPEDGMLLPEDAPYWSEKIEEFRKPKYTFDFVQDKPYSICCSPDAVKNNTFGYIDQPDYTDKSRNPCWYDKKRLRCVPYFFIVGASKTATMDLFKRLLVHPDIKTTKKEIHWFSRLRTLVRSLDYRAISYDNSVGYFSLPIVIGAGLRWYTSQFNMMAKEINTQIKSGEPSETVIGEISLDYLSDVHIWEHLTGNQGCKEPRITIASHVRHLNPKAKIIISLREPVKRLFSTYLYSAAAREKLKDPTTQKFHEQVARAVAAYKDCMKTLPVRVCVYNRTLSRLHPVDLISGAYAPFVDDWVRAFGKDQVFVVKFEDYTKSPGDTIKNIIKFLGLAPLSDTEFNEMTSLPNQKPNVYYKTGPMQNRTIKMLREFYTPFNLRLSKVLEDDRFLWK